MHSITNCSWLREDPSCFMLQARKKIRSARVPIASPENKKYPIVEGGVADDGEN